MVPKPTQQQLAKDLYLQTDKTQQEIADILNVNRRTIYLWVKNGKWAGMKNAAAQTPFTMQNEIHNHFSAINRRIRAREGDGCPTMQEVEMLRKLINMSAVIDKFHTGAYIEAFQELTTYIYHKDIDLARKVTLHADNYIKGHIGDDDEEYARHLAENIERVEKNLENDTEVEDPALPPGPLPEPPATDQVQSVAPQIIEPTPVTSSTILNPAQNVVRVVNDTRSTVLVSPSSNEGRGEANGISGHPCDKNAITDRVVKNSDKQLIINEINPPVTATPYPISNFSGNGISRPPAQHKGFIDPPANEVLGKG